MKQAALALLAGILFGAGLALSGMADPARVRGFLDVFGAWNPTLVFVMIGAVVPMGIAWRIQVRLNVPLAAERFSLPDTSRIDARLVSGSVIFGIGWGAAGLCPGPSLADLTLAPRPAAIFVLSMLTGMGLFKLANSRRARSHGAEPRGAMGKS